MIEGNDQIMILIHEISHLQSIDELINSIGTSLIEKKDYLKY